MEKEYNNAVDMWGLGCIVAELFGMMKEHQMEGIDPKALFPGRSCFPLTPCGDEEMKSTK